jgi:hypothetical protein
MLDADDGQDRTTLLPDWLIDNGGQDKPPTAKVAFATVVVSIVVEASTAWVAIGVSLNASAVVLE